jgi:hypothetical protein
MLSNILTAIGYALLLVALGAAASIRSASGRTGCQKKHKDKNLPLRKHILLGSLFVLY